VRIFITAQEIAVDNASYPTKEIAENSHIFRTLGLGYANLGSLIMSYGLAYDSDEGRALAGAITAIMTGRAYEQSAEIAAVMEPFEGYHQARCAHVDKPLARGQRRFHARSDSIAPRGARTNPAQHRIQLFERGSPQCWDRALDRGLKNGYRNAQVTVLAPTGTIAFLMDCDTTGVEPDIALVKYKLLAGGGMLKIVNRTVPEGLRRLNYSDKEIESIVAHVEKYDTIEEVEENGQDDPKLSQAGTSAGIRLRVQAVSRQAKHPLHGPFEHDVSGAAIHQRGDFQNGQFPPGLHSRRYSRCLPPGLAHGTQMRSNLSRRFKTLAAPQHQKNQ
jgi:ribonucleoside-diphosphate reductase alpha chain